MASVLVWLEAIAGIHALYDAITTGVDYAMAFERRRRDPQMLAEAERAQIQFSTYSDEEIKEISRRIEGCRKRFIEQGSGKDRSRCLCSVLNEIRDGNGGALPPIDNWPDMYDQLRCNAPTR